MKRAFLFLAVHKRLVAVLLTLFLSVSMMLMGEGNKTHIARTVTTAVFNTGRFTFSWGIYLLDIGRENKRLRLQNLELSDHINRHDAALRENDRLRRLLGFKQRISLTDSVIVGTVLGHDFDRIVNMMIVDIGTRDGVMKNMAVVTAEGLVGKVYDVYGSSCSVQIIMDANSKISAVVDGKYGIIRWEGGPYLRMFGLPLTTVPAPGAKLFTTGFGVYPEGLYIGKVSSRKFNEVEQYASVNVESDVDFSEVQEVFVIKGSDRSDIWDDGQGTGVFQRPEIK